MLAAGDYDFESLSSKIEEEYGIRVGKIDILDGQSFLITTGEGTLHVARYDDKESRILFISGIYHHIRDRGFHNISRIYKTRSGKYYMRSCDGGLYMVSEYNGSRCSFSIQGNEERIVELLARFHKASRGYLPPSGGKAKSSWGRWIERQKKGYRDIKNYRDRVLEKSDKTPFELMFLTSCDIYMGRMENSINLMKKKGYLDIVEESMRDYQICLGNFKQSNFCNIKSQIYIKSLDKCRYDMVEWDISELLRKFSESGTRNLKHRAEGLINRYNHENTLLDNSINIINAFLLYPEEYEKVISKHSRGKDKWMEGEYMDRLHSAMEQDDKNAEIAMQL